LLVLLQKLGLRTHNNQYRVARVNNLKKLHQAAEERQVILALGNSRHRCIYTVIQNF
jgi:hypothetical protein